MCLLLLMKKRGFGVYFVLFVVIFYSKGDIWHMPTGCQFLFQNVKMLWVNFLYGEFTYGISLSHMDYHSYCDVSENFIYKYVYFHVICKILLWPFS